MLRNWSILQLLSWLCSVVQHKAFLLRDSFSFIERSIGGVMFFILPYPSLSPSTLYSYNVILVAGNTVLLGVQWEIHNTNSWAYLSEEGAPLSLKDLYRRSRSLFHILESGQLSSHPLQHSLLEKLHHFFQSSSCRVWSLDCELIPWRKGQTFSWKAM